MDKENKIKKKLLKEDYYGLRKKYKACYKK